MIASVILVLVLVVGLYSAATEIISEGGQDTKDVSKDKSAVFECVQNNPGKSVEWCRENTAAKVVPDEPIKT